MNAYIIAHAPFFVAAQLAGLQAAYPGCVVTVVAARGTASVFEGTVKVVQSPVHGLLPMLRWFFPQASDGPAVFLEYDVVMFKPVTGNWMNQRGIQERSQTVAMSGLWPAAFGWQQKSDFCPSFFENLQTPFTKDWTPLVQNRAGVVGGLPECAENADFRMIGSQLLHYVNGTGRMTNERNECFKCCLSQFGISWRGPLIRSRGLGDMVAAGLSAVGITKERVQRVANAVGIKDCGCAKRQQALTELGRKFGIG